MRLSPVDSLLEDLYTEWGQSLMKDGQFEQAAKWQVHFYLLKYIKLRILLYSM